MTRLLLSVAVFGSLTALIGAAGSRETDFIQPGDEISEPSELDDYDDFTAQGGSSTKPDPNAPPRRVIKLWPDGVVKYKLSPSLLSDNPREIANLRAIMTTISQKTCVRFSQASAGEQSYVSVIPGLKCKSMLGKQEGVSTLMLSVKNCFNNGTLARGFMRILGFTYESNRADRDQFLTFNWDNVAEANKKKFTKLSADDYPVTDMPYDFLSSTHFPKNAWAINKSSWTVRAKRDPAQQLGNNRGLSDGDLAKIKKFYKCR
ncbi:hypothetical protein RvY_06744 [Ramazzottius varieornatus]|uniref:Metalloendopeptidase n=1 Tax=Ramazzottius varieornatus TaxID=947166 RepID=A0A1D1UZP1_RAMVA|nr:hypothetical protein RvY_06744 [Ramazzottius varieornatus]